MGNIYSITVSRPTRSGRGEVLVSRVVDVGEAKGSQVDSWFQDQYRGLIVKVEPVEVASLELPKLKEPVFEQEVAPKPDKSGDEIVMVESYLSDVNVPIVDEIREAFNKAKDAYWANISADKALEAAVASYYRDPFVQRIEGVKITYGHDKITYGHDKITVGKIVLDRKLFEARIRKEVLPTNPDEAVKLM